MDLQGDPLTTSPIQTGWEICNEPQPNWRFGYIDDPDHQFGHGSVLTRTRTRTRMMVQNCFLHYARPTSIDAQLKFSFKMGQGAFRFVLFRYRQPILHLWLSRICSPSDSSKYMTNNHQCSIEANCQDGVDSMSLFLLIIMVANTSKSIATYQCQYFAISSSISECNNT
jgi:hypothetical protein